MHITHVNLAKGFRGGERQTAILIKQLSQRPDIQQQLVCRIDSSLRDDLKGTPKLAFITANSQLGGHFDAHKTDVVHAHEAKALHWAWLHHLLTKTPYILTRRVDTPVRNKWINKLSYSGACARVAVSSFIQDALQAKAWGKVDLVFSVKGDLSYDLESVKAIKNEFEGKTLVGHIGALVDEHKGQKIIIDCARKLADSHPSFLFICLGEGKDREQLESLSSDLTNIKWLGFKKNIGDYIHAFDYFIFPSRNEGLGSTLLDVIDARVPVIATNVGGIPDIVKHELTGLSVPPDDAEALANALLRMDQDKNLQTGLIEQASAHLQSFTPAVMAQNYIEIYKKALN